MRPVHVFSVIPRLPEELEGLRELAYNLWWCWDPDTILLFRRLDQDLWEQAYHNPVRMLGTISQSRLYRVAGDSGFKAHLNRVLEELRRYVREDRWYQRKFGAGPGFTTAYFSAEFGLTESVPIYSGGLGILAGDHLKSASDLGLPLVGVGLLYQKGYFKQYLNADGWQQELYPVNDFFTMPVQPVPGPGGRQAAVEIGLPGRKVTAQIWRLDVGRVPLYLLDTNVPANAPADRNITGELYGGDLEMRIQQEIVLGIGGLRALRSLGVDASICHMNEGHSAFLALERARLLMEAHRVPFAEAWELVSAGTIFTTHTPVPAGIDHFPLDLVERYFSEYWPALGVTREQFLSLGQERPGENFSMAALGLRAATQSNGVSRLHGEVSRRMWTHLWPGVPLEEVSIRHVTNGIHYRSWISKEMSELYDRYLGTDWQDDPAAEEVWRRVDDIPDEELWRTHEVRREKLIVFARKRLREQLLRRGASSTEVRESSEVLNPQALTIGFARRFATYKRATLLFKDVERLVRIISDSGRPVQIIYAGKAHPRDNQGKDFIRQIVHFSRRPELRQRVIFLEDYDICVARYLVQGVDLWLNNPLRPLEASGTSGMKAAANAVLNLSVLDGWWDEVYSSSCGWAIGHGEEYEDKSYQDYVESQALYDLLENDIVPRFYRRDQKRLPRDWIGLMKSSLKVICPFFNTSRMVRQYAENAYFPSAAFHRYLLDSGQVRARSLAAFKARVRERWPQVRILRVAAKDQGADSLTVGAELAIQAEVDLGGLPPDEVSVEIYHGLVGAAGEFQGGQQTRMEALPPSNGDGVRLFEGRIPCEQSGLCGYTVRVLPRHPDLAEPRSLGLIHWAGA